MRGTPANLVDNLYNRAMGLFRRRKKREKAAAQLPTEQAMPAKPQPEGARREVTRQARPDPDQPGWGRTIGQEIAKAREQGAGQQ